MKRLAIRQIEDLLFGSKTVEQSTLDEIKHDERKGVQKLIERYNRKIQKEQDLKEDFYKMMVYEEDLKIKGIRYIAGIDEVGRGPLAGPVVSSAVILPTDFYLPGLTDSKKLPKDKRDEFYSIIIKEAIAFHVSIVPATVIDEVNIYQATKRSMLEAVNGLDIQPEHLLIDAMELKVLLPQTSLIKGDQKSVSIAASSVVAKVTRDRYMERLGEIHPHYGFEKHMGYGTKEHLEAIDKYGVIDEHRRSFAPIRESIATAK
ncbi:ribonuclease HII [Bacillus sp. FJAT-45350]|uniref:ribonuclease HII n=1 Tax=Bacillus sp. FJAT-45350 TaxID=2011014 RepID=UPI000BB86DD9|nr:ribonuclease HII [Bacillus sp. FJAT-45350]